MRSGTLMAAVLVLTMAVGGCGLLDRSPQPETTIEAFAASLRDGEVDASLLAQPGTARAAADLVTATIEALGGTPRVRPLETERDPDDGDRATGVLRIRWELPKRAWRYDTEVDLVRGEEEWQVVWRPSVLHPALEEGHALRLRWVAPERAPILDGNGAPLFTPQPIVVVGVQPGRVTDLEQVVSVLTETLGVQAEPLRERIETAPDDRFVEVITLRRGDYEAVRDVLQPVPGTVFRQEERLLSPATEFARGLLGTVGAPTAEILEGLPEGFDVGDDVGRSGLQRIFNGQLSGTPGYVVEVMDADGEAVSTAHEVAPEPGQPLRTTLAPAVQAAADAAVAGRPAMIVAVRASTGEVLAVAEGPEGGSGITPFTGQYPPGSSYKIVSTAALLRADVAPDAPVTCPDTAAVGGRTFRNSEGRAYGEVPLRTAFAQSCNTTFVSLVPALDDEVMAATAADFGFGGDWHPGIEAFTGSAPQPTDDVERAAALIGQGRVLASPLLMASVAAAVPDGTWRPPVLLPDHADRGAGPVALDPGIAATLADFTRAVVSEGTGGALRDVPGAPVHGKTGTAEYGTEDPPRTHAWFVGYRDDIAFAVFVPDGGGGSSVAAPLAAEFLELLG